MRQRGTQYRDFFETESEHEAAVSDRHNTILECFQRFSKFFDVAPIQFLEHAVIDVLKNRVIIVELHGFVPFAEVGVRDR